VCGRYLLKSPPQVVADLFGLTEVPDLRPRYNVAPTQQVAAVGDFGGGRRLSLLRWGLIPFWSRADAGGTGQINARSETAADKPSFRQPFRTRRCLVPADGFFEWLQEGRRKRPYLFRLRGGAPFAFAGLWDRWEGPSGPVQSCAVLTTSANDLVGRVHDRMPVILNPSDFDRWLDPAEHDPAVLLPLLRPYPADLMESIAVSDRVNNARNDDPSCVEPAA
jgi:putative SOS response-associated peptidase YedK